MTVIESERGRAWRRPVVKRHAMTQALPDTEQRTNETAPPGVLTWRSTAERNQLLDLWRLAVFTMFAEQPRALRLAWTLEHLFHGKTGYAYASNSWLAKKTVLAENKLRDALATLEKAGAIVRGYVPHNGQKQRVIYPATGILPCPTVGRRGEPQQVGHHNLSKRRARLPRTQMDAARLAAAVRDGVVASGRDDGNDSARGPKAWPSAGEPVTFPFAQVPPSERRRDGQATQAQAVEATSTGRGRQCQQ
jgi:hypothetical protein